MHLDVTASDETDMPTSKGKIQRGKWMTFSSKKSRGMFNQDELSKPVDSTAAFSPTSGNAITNDDEALFTLQDNPFAKDTFIPVDTQPRRVSVTSLDSTTSIEPFEEDPFKSCDPFSMSIPVIREDPFEANASDPFGTEVNDPFGDQNITHDPFSTSGPDVFANSSFPSKPFDVDQSPHISSSANNQTVADDKFENAFGSAPFMDQNPATFSTQTDPFAPIGSKPEETSECENPFKENAFVQPQSSTNDSFSASVKNNPDTSTAQTNENLFGDSFSDTITRTTNQTTDPFGVSLNTNQQSEGQTSNPFEDDKFQPLSTNDSFASNDVTPSVADPFTCGAVAPSVEDNPSNPLELDAFVPGQIPIAEQVVEMTRETDKETATAEECVGNVDDSSQKGDHHVTFADDSKLAVTFETYSRYGVLVIYNQFVCLVSLFVYLSVQSMALPALILSTCLSVCQVSVHLSTCLPVCLSTVCLSIVCQSVYMSVCLSIVCQSVYMSVCLSVYLSVCLSTCLSAVNCLSVCLHVCLSVCQLFVCLPVCLSVCLPVCLYLLVCLLSVCLSVCLFVCLTDCLSVCLLVCLPICQLSLSVCLSIFLPVLLVHLLVSVSHLICLSFSAHMTFYTIFLNAHSSDYMRKDPTVDPQRAELEVIHDEHKTIKCYMIDWQCILFSN